MLGVAYHNLAVEQESLGLLEDALDSYNQVWSLSSCTSIFQPLNDQACIVTAECMGKGHQSVRVFQKHRQEARGVSPNPQALHARYRYVDHQLRV